MLRRFINCSFFIIYYYIMQWSVCINCRTNVCYTLQFVFAIIAFRCIRLNKCIWENTKGADRRSQNSIRKTKNTFYRTQVTDPLPKFCIKKLLLHTKFYWDRAVELWPKTTFNGGHTPSWVLKIFAFVHLAVIEFQMCSHLPNFIKIGSFSVEIWRFYDLQYSGVRDLEFSKFRVYVMWPLSPCYSASTCKISLKLDNPLLSYGQKKI